MAQGSKHPHVLTHRNPHLGLGTSVYHSAPTFFSDSCYSLSTLSILASDYDFQGLVAGLYRLRNVLDLV